MPATRRPREVAQKKVHTAKVEPLLDDGEEEILSFRSPRILNEPSPRDPDSAEGVLEEVRRLLLKSRAAKPKEEEKVQKVEDSEDFEDDVSEADNLPGCQLGLPTLEEMAHRMEQIEADADAIRERWRTLQFEDVDEDVSCPVMPLENRAMLFTKLPRGPGAEGKKVPRPPTTVRILTTI